MTKSKSILSALERVKPKVDILKEKTKQCNILSNQILFLENEIFNLYSVLFKNFMSKRIVTKLTKKDNPNHFICLNEQGFSLLYMHSDNSTYFNSFHQLYNIYEFKKDILEYIKNSSKRKLFKKFFWEFKNIKITDSRIFIEKKMNIKILNEVDDNKYYNFLEYKGLSSILFSQDNKEYSYINHIIEFGYITLKDYLFIEKYYYDMLKLINKTEKHLLKMIKERTKVLNNLTTKFSSEIILNKL